MVLRYATTHRCVIAASEGLQDLCAVRDSFPSRDAIKRKTGLRDELFQDLMKVCLAANKITAHAHTSSLCLLRTYESGFCMLSSVLKLHRAKCCYALVAGNTMKSQ